jgi:hypothetical protein
VVGVAVFAVDAMRDAMLVVKIIPKKCVAGTAAEQKKNISREPGRGERKPLEIRKKISSYKPGF